MGETPTFASDAVDWSDIGDQLMTGAIKGGALAGLRDAIIGTLTDKEAAVKAFVFDSTVTVALKLGELLRTLEEPLEPVVAAFVAPVLQGLFGANIDAGAFGRRVAAGGGAAAGGAIVDGFINAVKGEGAGGAGDATDAGARRLASAAVAASLESTINAALPEMLSDFVPEIGHFTALTDIPEQIIRTLGVSRLVRRALSPMIDAVATTPSKWYYHKLYQQTLLVPGEVARQVARERWTKEQATEELSRHGYSADRIEAVLNAANKFMGPADLYLLIRAKQWDSGAAQQHLQDAGYDSPLASTLLMIEQLKQIAQFEDAMAIAAVDAFAAGRIDEGTLGGFVHGSTMTDQHSAQLTELAHAKRVCGARDLTATEAEACVLAGVASYSDYRDALARENRTEDAISMLEVLLRSKVDARTTAADHKAAAAADAAAAKAARLAAAQAKALAHQKAVAQAQLGKPADIEKAYLRGLVPIERVQEVLSPLYDADTVGVLTATLEDERAAAVKQQQARDAAAARAGQRGINVGQLETAVTSGVLGLQELHDRLLALNFPAADADVITATLKAKMQAAADAKVLHDDAVAKAKIKHVDLATIELLVRRGHSTMADFNATLTTLGYDVPSIAALDEKLQLEIDADAAAAKVKADAAAKAAAKGLNLAQAERAVLLGVQTIDWFTTWLIHAGTDPTAMQTIVATVKAEADQAEAARQRRAAAQAKSDASQVPVATLARAARLGVIPVAAYTAALTARGYNAGDIALETDLLTTELANTAAALAKHGAATGTAKQKGLNLGQLDAAVKDGKLTIDAYTQRVVALGYSTDDAILIASVVDDQAQLAATLRAKRAAITADAATKHVNLGQLDVGVLDGLVTPDAYTAQLTGMGYAPEDVALLLGELEQRQAKLSTATARAAQLATQDPGKEATRADFAKSVTDGLKTIDDYTAFLTEQGYGSDDVDLYVALEQFTLDKAAAKAAPVPPA
jgi:hypothetical protein